MVRRLSKKEGGADHKKREESIGQNSATRKEILSRVVDNLALGGDLSFVREQLRTTTGGKGEKTRGRM